MLASRALSIASRRRGLVSGSPPPSFAATVISLMRRVNTLPFFASAAALRCLMFAHLLCPAMGYDFSHAPASSRCEGRQDGSRPASRGGEPPRLDHRRDRD